MKNFKIKHKIIMGTMVIFLITSLFGFFIYKKNIEKNEVFVHVKMHIEMPKYALEMLNFFDNASFSIQKISENLNNPEFINSERKKFEKSISSLEKSRVDFENLVEEHNARWTLPPEKLAESVEHEINHKKNKQIYVEIKNAYEDFSFQSNQFFLLLDKKENKEVSRFYEENVSSSVHRMDDLMTSFIILQEWESNFHTYASNELQKEIDKFIVGFVILIGAFSLLFGFAYANFIFKPFSSLSDIIQEISLGNLGRRIPVKSNDEVGVVASKFNHMMDRISASQFDLEASNRKLTESEKKFKLLTDLSPDCIKIIDKNRKIAYMNPSGLKEHDFKNLKEAIGWDFLESVVDEQKEEVARALNECLMEGTESNIDVNHKHGTANREWCNFSIIPIKNENEEIDGILAISRDISQIKENIKNLTEDEKRNDESKKAIINILEDFNEEKEKIAREKAKDEALLESIGDGVVATDKNGKIMFINQAAEILIGYSSLEIVGKSWTEEVVLPIDISNKRILEKDTLTYKTLSLGKKYSKNLFYTKKDGSKFPVSITTSPILLDSQILGAVVVFRDITKEQEVDKAKTEFVSLASHQLRTPLTAINWYLEMIMNGDAGKVTEDQKKYLEEAYRGSQRMVELVNALLNVSRLDLGTFAVEPKPVNVIDVFNEELKELGFQIENKKMKIETNYGKDIPIMQMDPNLIRIVFQNFLTNAIKYTPEGGKISIKLEKLEKDLLVEISDTGYGIPKNQQDKLFTKLFRADNIREKETVGTGLGMYIVKAIIEQSGGKIWFESEENKGTVFHVTIPLSGMKKKEGAKGLSA